MSRPSHPHLSATLLIAGVVLAACPAPAVQVTAGWTHADVGLQNEGDGLFLGVGSGIPLASRIFDASYALEYVQKAGSQPTFFSDRVQGFAAEDAKVTLHCVQRSLFLGARVPDLGFVPRLYVGTSLVLKVKESWSDFPGRPSIAWGYTNTDFVGHLGASVGVGPATLDFRYTHGFLGQLVQDNQPLPLAGKSAVGPEGSFTPYDGSKISSYQLTAGFTF